MLSNPKKISFLILLILCFLGGLFLLFHQNTYYTLQEAACTFNERSINCLDSSIVWNQGISFFDSELKKGQDTLTALKSLLFEKWEITFSKDSMNALSALFPLEVLSSKKAGCMGVAWLALMVAEQENIDLDVIMLPNHVFLRYKGINFEPNRKGFAYSNQEYAEKYKEGVWTGLEWNPLTKKEFLGLVTFNVGNTFLKEKPKQALSWYKLAKTMFPQYPGISNNQKWAKGLLGI